MKKKIDYMAYCKDGDSERILVMRKFGKMRFYRNLTFSSKRRFDRLKEHCTAIDFSTADTEVDILIAMHFERSNDI